MIKVYRVWAKNGHRQRESFFKSYAFKTLGATVRVRCADVTLTHDYVYVEIEGESEEVCQKAFDAQLSDGIFECSRYGKIEVIQ